MSYVVSYHLRLYNPICQSHRHAAISWQSPYTQRLRCAGAPRRPAGPSRLSLLSFPYVPSTIPRRPAATSRCTSAAIPDFLEVAPSHRRHTHLYQRHLTGILFRGCIVRFMLRPACLPSPPGWLRRDKVTCASPRLLRYIVIRAFHTTCYQAVLRIRLNGRTGNLPLSGLTPDQLQQLVRLHVTAESTI
jgi:hypothetical protein